MRSRANHIHYKRHTKTTPHETCSFCALTQGDGQVVSESEHFWTAINLFAYDLWDDRNVDEHLMLLPKRHVMSLGNLTPAEQVDYMKQLAVYEDLGYSTYTRAPTNASRSIPHLHTHLFKLKPQTKRIIVRMKRPYILWAA